jgi:hypothetical protein
MKQIILFALVMTFLQAHAATSETTVISPQVALNQEYAVLADLKLQLAEHKRLKTNGKIVLAVSTALAVVGFSNLLKAVKVAGTAQLDMWLVILKPAGQPLIWVPIEELSNLTKIMAAIGAGGVVGATNSMLYIALKLDQIDRVEMAIDSQMDKINNTLQQLDQ